MRASQREVLSNWAHFFCLRVPDSHMLLFRNYFSKDVDTEEHDVCVQMKVCVWEHDGRVNVIRYPAEEVRAPLTPGAYKLLIHLIHS